MGGALTREAVARELGASDLVVVPSLWYENSPLVILEARAVGTPLLVSDQGGMAELVEVGRTGWHFKMGDVGDLARMLGELCAEPARLRSLEALGLELPSIEEHVALLEERYLRFARERAARR